MGRSAGRYKITTNHASSIDLTKLPYNIYYYRSHKSDQKLNRSGLTLVRENIITHTIKYYHYIHMQSSNSQLTCDLFIYSFYIILFIYVTCFIYLILLLCDNSEFIFCHLTVYVYDYVNVYAYDYVTMQLFDTNIVITGYFIIYDFILYILLERIN